MNTLQIIHTMITTINNPRKYSLKSNDSSLLFSSLQKKVEFFISKCMNVILADGSRHLQKLGLMNIQ